MRAITCFAKHALQKTTLVFACVCAQHKNTGQKPKISQSQIQTFEYILDFAFWCLRSLHAASAGLDFGIWILDFAIVAKRVAPT